jgi:Spy/CpxP family protein refolding chaperone
METNRFLKFVIVLLLALDIAAMAFIWYGRVSQSAAGTATKVMMSSEHPPAAKPGEDPVENFICGELKFTDAQCAQYRRMHEGFRDSMETLQQHDRDLHDSFFALSTAANADPARVRAMADSLAANQVQIELRTFYHFQNIKAICTPEQAKEFDRVIHEALRMMAPHQPQGLRPEGPPPR